MIGVIKLSSSTVDQDAGASLNYSTGGIQSTPGAINQTAQYAALQATQNIEQAEQARKTGASAIPTIIRTHAFGEGVQIIGQKDGEAGADFSALLNDNSGETQHQAWVDALKKNSCSKASMNSVITEGGSISDLKAVCSCEQLKNAGYTVRDLVPVCSCAELKSASFDIVQLKEGGLSAGRLRLCGYTACDERGVGFTAQQMKDADFSDGELKGAGFSEPEIARAGGLPDGVTLSDVQRAAGDVNGLARLRAQGVTAAAIRRINGSSPDQLIAAGFTAKELKNAGYSAADLKNAGLNVAALREAGFTPRDLLNAGFTKKDLASAGFSASEINDAEAMLPLGLTPMDVKKAGCSDEAIKRQQLVGVSDELIKKYAGCNLDEVSSDVDSLIRAAGSDPEKLRALLNQGISASRIRALTGAGADALKKAGFDAKSLINAGLSPEDLLKAGFTPADLSAAMAAGAVSDDVVKAAGSDPEKLRALLNQGISASRIRALTGAGADTLKKAGFDAKSLLEAGLSPEDLLKAGFTPADLSAAMAAGAVSDDVVKAAGSDPEKLRDLLNKGVSASRIRALTGAGADALKKAGFDAKSLINAGLSPEDLLKAGFTPADLSAAMAAGAVSDDVVKAAGSDPEKLKALLAQNVTADRIRRTSGASLDALKAAGFDAKSLADAGFTPEQLLAAGFTPEQLTQAGLNPMAVIATGRTAGCSVQSLSAAHKLMVSAETIKQTLGCGAKALKDAGFTPTDLKNAGFTAAELKKAGLSFNDLKNAGFSPKELADAGATPQQLKEAGLTLKQLKEAGISAANLKQAGFTADQLKEAGFNTEALKQAGFSAADMKAAGFSADQLKKVGYTPSELQQAGFSTVAGLNTLSPPPEVPSEVGLTSALTQPANTAAAIAEANAKRIADMRSQQEKQAAAQRYQQKIQQRGAAMLTAANQVLQESKVAPQQTYTAGSNKDEDTKQDYHEADYAKHSGLNQEPVSASESQSQSNGTVVIKTGDILFAVIDTSVNSDEPGPLLATIVSGKLQGSKLIGSFNLPGKADKMIVTFNTLSIPGEDNTVSISAVAIDPNTARTALSSETDHHYLSRYGSLFASTFLEGFGNAFQSSNTTISIGGTGGTTNTTVQSGIGRSTMDNAVIGLATVGKAWGQVAAQNMNRPTTVQLFAGTGVGVLFTQTLKLN